MGSRRFETCEFQPERPVYLDDRLGPTLTIIWLLALASAATVLGIGHQAWQEGQLWPVVAVLGVGGAALSLSLAAALLSPRRLSRRAIIALCFSLLLNLSLAVGLASVYLPTPVVQLDEEDAEPVVEEQPPTYPEFFEMADQGDDRPQQDVQKPVNTGELQRDQRDLVRKTIIRDPQRDKLMPDATPETEMRIAPATVSRRQLVRAAPRRAQQQGTLARQRLESRPDAAAQASIPSINRQSDLPTMPAAQPPATESQRPSQPRHVDLPAERRLDEADAVARSDLQMNRSDDMLRWRRDPAGAEAARPSSDFPAFVDRVPRKRSSVESTTRRPDHLVPAPVPRVPHDQSTQEPAKLRPVAQPLEQRSLAPDADLQEAPDLTRQLVRHAPQGMARSSQVAKVPRNVSLQVDLPDRLPVSATQPTSRLVEVEPLEHMMPETEQPVDTSLASRPLEAPATLEHPLNLPSPQATADEPRPLTPPAGVRVARRDEAPGIAEVSSPTPSPRTQQPGGTEADQIETQRNQLVLGRTPRFRKRTHLNVQRSRSRQVRRPELPRTAEPAEPQAAPMTEADRIAKRGEAPSSSPSTLADQAQPVAGLPDVLAESAMRRSGRRTQPKVLQDAAAFSQPARQPVEIAAPQLPTEARGAVTQHSASRATQPLLTAASQGLTRQIRPAVPAAPRADPTGQPSGLPSAPQMARPQLARSSILAQPDVADPMRNGQGVSLRSRQIGAARASETPDAEVDVPLVRHVSRSAASEVAPRRLSLPDRVRAHPRKLADVDRPELDVPAIEGPTTARSSAWTQPRNRVTALPEEPAGPQPARRKRLQRANRDRGGDTSVATDLYTAASTESPELPTGSPTAAQTTDTDTFPSRSSANAARRGRLQVDIEAGEGIGGLASDISLDVGSLSRHAVPESAQVVDTVGRFQRRRVGGPLSIAIRTPTAASAYQTRLNRQGLEPFGGNGRPSPRTEEAIELGLLYLSQLQQEDGSWSLQRTGERAHLPQEEQLVASLKSQTAATGLCLLSYLGAGYHHRSEKYGSQVLAGLNFLIDHQRENGDLYIPMDRVSNQCAWLYSHGIAAIALCEAYGMTQDPDLRDAAQRSIDFIVSSQQPQRGGWRYTPQFGSDTSVSGWMVMAMRSAELANLDVPTKTWQQVEQWLDLAKASEQTPFQFRYNPFALDNAAQGHGRRPSKTMTAVGLLMRMYTGWRRDDPALLRGARYLKTNLPAVGSWDNPQRDTYYWYYATQVMFHMGGEFWEQWNAELHPMLTSSQVQIGPLAGSWDPQTPIPDRWAAHAGRVYVTTLNLLSLEVYYRHLPIYEDTAR